MNVDFKTTAGVYLRLRVFYYCYETTKKDLKQTKHKLLKYMEIYNDSSNSLFDGGLCVKASHVISHRNIKVRSSSLLLGNTKTVPGLQG